MWNCLTAHLGKRHSGWGGNGSRKIYPSPACTGLSGDDEKDERLSVMDLTEELTREPKFQMTETASSLPARGHPETH